MSNAKVPEGWVEKDIREVIPEAAIPVVLKFCQNILRESKAPDFDGGKIASRAKVLLEPHTAAFAANETDVGFFSYWLEHAWNQGMFEKMVETLKVPLDRPKSVPLEKVLPPEGLSTLRGFLENCQKGTLIIEPGKPYVTLLRERVLEPYRDYILNKSGSGITDLHYLALTICMAANLEPGEVPG